MGDDHWTQVCALFEEDKLHTLESWLEKRYPSRALVLDSICRVKGGFDRALFEAHLEGDSLKDALAAFSRDLKNLDGPGRSRRNRPAEDAQAEAVDA